MGKIYHINTLIDRERQALYACAKAKCRDCPWRHQTNENQNCMMLLLKDFEKIINELRGRKNNGKALH